MGTVHNHLEMREKNERADACLGEKLREARRLQEELQTARSDLQSLRVHWVCAQIRGGIHK